MIGLSLIRPSRAKIMMVLSDIRFWILFCFVVRLVGITNPPLEVSHNWRQTLGTMVTRNFLEVNSNILYPRIDVGGDHAGITGMEFPLFNYISYLMSVLFGYRHWYGRLVNLVVSSFGVLYFFRLIRDQLKCRQLAFYSAMVLLFSLWFSCSRKIMPDTFAMSFVIAALYHGCRYLGLETCSSGRRFVDVALFGVFAAIGMLTKLPSGYLLPVLAMPFLRRGVSAAHRTVFASVALLSISTTLAWYFCWVPHLTETYGVSHFFMGVGFGEGFHELAGNWPLALKRFYETAIKYIGFVVSLVGLGWVVLKRDRLIMGLLLLSFPFFIGVVAMSGYNFAHHTYYVIPYVPVMALLAGVGLRAMKRPYLIVFLLAAICIEGVSDQQPDFRVKEHHRELLALEADLDACCGRESLIVVNGAGSPTAIYFAHRRGWSLPNEGVVEYSRSRDLRQRGLKCIVVLNNVFGAVPVDLGLPISIQRNAYTIYVLE